MTDEPTQKPTGDPSPEAASPPLREAHVGPTVRLTLDRPAVLNALTPELLDALAAAVRRADADPQVRAILITGAGRGFCAGADLAATPLDGDVETLVRRHYSPAVTAIRDCATPVVAAVNGVAAGAGLSLALACDVRLASPSARFAVGFSGIGLALDAGASWTLPRRVGEGRALELIYTNRRVGAAEALDIGLVEVVLDEADGDAFAGAALAWTDRIATGPTLAYRLAKTELRAAAGVDFGAQLEHEARAQAEAAASRDAREGVAAFREKRAPRFEGR